jgi:tetratricopeptide (TPR) repeat protein
MSDPQKPPPEFLRAIEAYQKGAEADDSGQMDAAAWKALEIAMEAAEKNPTPPILLKQEAAEHEGRGNWPAAEACYRKALALDEETGHPGLVCQAHLALSQLFLLLGDVDRAEASANAAAASARKDNNTVLLCMTLENQAHCALRRSDSALALELASEAAVILPGERIFDNQRAGSRVTRAQCRLASGDVAGAEEDLLAARANLIDKPISPIFAGLQSRAAKWWQVTAEARACKGDHRGACEAWAEVVKIRRHVVSLMHVAGPQTRAALARSLAGFGEALGAAGDSEASEAASAEARRIRLEIGLPQVEKDF